MNIQGTYTNKGLALTAKTAAGACLRVTRVVGGSGHTPDIPGATALPEIRQTLTVGEARCAGDTAVLPVTLAAVGLESSYTLTELGVYAEDPNEGEILYCVYRLDESTTIRPGATRCCGFTCARPSARTAAQRFSAPLPVSSPKATARLCGRWYWASMRHPMPSPCQRRSCKPISMLSLVC